MGSTSQLDRRKDKNTASEGTLFIAIRLLYRPLDITCKGHVNTVYKFGYSRYQESQQDVKLTTQFKTQICYP